MATTVSALVGGVLGWSLRKAQEDIVKEVADEARRALTDARADVEHLDDLALRHKDLSEKIEGSMGRLERLATIDDRTLQDLGALRVSDLATISQLSAYARSEELMSLTGDLRSVEALALKVAESLSVLHEHGFALQFTGGDDAGKYWDHDGRTNKHTPDSDKASRVKVVDVR